MREIINTFPPAALARLRQRNLLRNLLEQELLAELVESVSVSEDDQKQALMQFSNDDPKGLADQMARTHGWTQQDLEWQALKPLRIQRYCQIHHAAKAESRFLQRKSQLDLVVYSLIRVQDGALARELYFQLASGEANFAELASQYSQGPERSTSGIIGPKPLTDAHPELAERLRTARDGELMDPFVVSNWWLVVCRDRYIPATFNDAVSEQMAKELFNEWLQEEVTRRIGALNLQAGSGQVNEERNG